MKIVRTLLMMCFVVIPVSAALQGCGSGDAYVPSTETPPEMTDAEKAAYEKEQLEMQKM